MFGLSRGQLKNALILAFSIFLIKQVHNELSQNMNPEVATRVVEPLAPKTNVAKPAVIAKNTAKKGGKKGDNFRQERLALKKEKENLLNERENLQKMLWEASIKNIIAGNDELSPLVQPLPRVYAQDDPELIQIIRDKYLLPPSKDDYNIKATEDTSMGQAQLIRKIFNNKKNGLFIECGALDGETRSNSLFLEKENNWRGILIEADPMSLIQVRSKNRKAWLVPACLSTKRETMYVTFAAFGHIGHIAQEDELDSKASKYINVTCLPLYSILMALDNPTIDYFSLDVEGSELAVLKTIPFDKVDIKSLSVEFFHLDELGASNNEMKDYMISQGYDYHSTVKARLNHANDFIFVKKGLIS